MLIDHATRVLAVHGFDPHTSINLVSTCRDEICRPFTEKLDRIWGSSFNISSLAGAVINNYPYFSYNASKAALNHFTRALAIQYGKQGIRSNAIMPGLMATPMVQAQIAGQYADAAAMQRARDAASPTGKQGDAWDIARAALFLASDDAKYINGVCLPVDGGLHCLAG